MHTALKEALNTTIRNWEAMAKADFDHSESAADQFEHSFYQFIEVFRDWVNQLDPRPDTTEDLLQLEACREILEQLPEPLHLNFETEADLIIDDMERIEEDKYD